MRTIERGHEVGDQRLYDDSLSENPNYNEDVFRRRFRTRRHLFLHFKQNIVKENKK